MKSVSPLAPAAATLLLHAALIATVLAGLSDSRKSETPPKPITVELVRIQPPTPLPVAPAAPPAPAPEKKRPEPKPRAEHKPAPVPREPREVPAPKVQAPDVSFDAKPSSSTSAAVPATPAPSVQAAPASPAPPAKTSVSVASYAASNRKPPYPRLSRLNDEQGTVVLRVLVKADGTAGNVEIKTSSGYPLLDESARTTVQTWRFNPATVDGKPISEWYQVTIPFTLQNN
jgi:protein TonB